MEVVEKIYLDDETGDYVSTKYFINGIEIDEEEYCKYLDADISEEEGYYCLEDDESECYDCEDCEPCENCGEFPCDCQCNYGEYGEECNVSDEDIDFQLLIETFLDEINSLDCEGCQMEALYRLYNLAYQDGRKSLAYGLSDLMADIVEE